MLLIPNAVFTGYVAHLNTHGIASAIPAEHKKWLRYYLDFCDKYPVPESKSERVRLFCEKLREKKQSDKQRQRAAHAVSLYFEMKQEEERTKARERYSLEADAGTVAELKEYEMSAPAESQYVPDEPERLIVRRSPSQFTEAGYQEKKSPEWDAPLPRWRQRSRCDITPSCRPT